MNDRPYFSIGVTTFKRKEMLVECVKSILDQSLPNFEVLIGNDCTTEKLSLQDLGIDDHRVKIINHSVNLGEVDNMNYLMEHSRGKWFTWLADDDAYHPHFLRVVNEVFQRDAMLDGVFTSYWSAEAKTEIPRIDPAKVVATKLSIDPFLERYLARQIAVIGCYGVFRSDFIRDLGGMRKVGSGIGPYSDNLLGIRAAALGRVAYVDQPLIFYRIHGGSLSCSSDSVEAYTSAQTEFVQEVDRLVKERVRPEKYVRLRFDLFQWFVRDLASVWARSRRNLRPLQIWKFIRLARTSYFSKLPLKHKFYLALVTSRLVWMLIKKSVRDAVVFHAH